MTQVAAEVTRVTAEEIKERMERGEQFTFVDARNPKAWQESGEELPGAIRMTPEEAERRISELPRNRAIITYCT